MSTFSRRAFLQSAALTAMSGAAGASAVEALIGPISAWRSPSERKVRIGVVGGGFGLSFHWHEHPNCIVHAVSDLLPERREALMGRYACGKAYDSLEELVLDPDIEAVALFTPAPDHARHTLLCFEHGKHVISACPAVMSLGEAKQLLRARERSGLKYMSAETSYYRWETQFARLLYKEGIFGDIVYCEGEYYHPAIGAAGSELSMRNGQRTWRWGFPPMLYPTHSTAFLVGVTGERLTSVSCIGTRNETDPAFQDNQYDNPFVNGMAMFETEKGYPFRCNVAWDIFADGERAQWFGRNATMVMPGYAAQSFALKLGTETITQMPDFFPLLPEPMRKDTGHGASHPFITNEFVMALVEDREPEIDLDMALAFCVPGIVAHESALKGGRRLDIPMRLQLSDV